MRALTRDYEITRRMSEATIEVTVWDINDNNPIFTEKYYNVSIMESEKHPKVIVRVKATDLDSANTAEEIERGFGVVRYSLSGENINNTFEIDPVTGTISVSNSEVFYYCF